MVFQVSFSEGLSQQPVWPGRFLNFSRIFCFILGTENVRQAMLQFFYGLTAKKANNFGCQYKKDVSIRLMFPSGI
jgi:hypothetical protein